MRFYIPKHNRKSFLKKISLPLTASFLFAATVIYWNSKTFGLALEYNGQQIATVQREEVYEKAKEMIRSQTPVAEKHRISNATPRIKIAEVEKNKCIEKPEEIKDKIIEKSSEILAPAYGAYVEDKLLVVGTSKEDIQKALDEILNENKANLEDATATFEENIEIRQGLFPNSKIEGFEKIKEALTSKAEVSKPYTVTENDTVVSIAEKFGISTEKLLKDNGKTASDSIYPGDTLNIITFEDLLHVKVVAKETVENEIPFEKITKEDSEIEKGKVIVDKEGSNGKEEVVYCVTYLNGKETDKKESAREIKLEPTAEEQTIGTKQEEYIWPVPFTKNITSGFGPRWGTYHYGIDISSAGVEGTDIVASKAGTVKVAKTGNTGYGNHIIILHDDGTETLYGHCKSLCTSAGKRVNQGEKIACVGSTGQSTGPHLHFEVRINGKKVNPIQYVK